MIFPDGLQKAKMKISFSCVDETMDFKSIVVYFVDYQIKKSIGDIEPTKNE